MCPVHYLWAIWTYLLQQAAHQCLTDTAKNSDPVASIMQYLTKIIYPTQKKKDHIAWTKILSHELMSQSDCNTEFRGFQFSPLKSYSHPLSVLACSLCHIKVQLGWWEILPFFSQDLPSGLNNSWKTNMSQKNMSIKRINGTKKNLTVLQAQTTSRTIMMVGLIVWVVKSSKLSSSTLLPLILCDNFCFLPLKHMYQQFTYQVSPSAAWF